MLSEELKQKIKLKKPFYMKDQIHDIFSWKELEQLLNLRPFCSTNRLIPYRIKEQTWPNQAWLSSVNTWPPSILKKILNETMFYFSDASRVNKKVNQLCKELERTLGLPTDAHIYFNVSEHLDQGFKIHWDYSHNLIVQVTGTTNFKIWDFEKEDENIREVDELDRDPIIDVIMNPGDLVFVPVFHWHRAVSLTKRCSISFPSIVDTKLEMQDRNWIKLNT